MAACIRFCASKSKPRRCRSFDARAVRHITFARHHDAIEHIRSETEGVALDVFEADWRRRWLVERGIEIISEASRHLPPELKDRHPEIPWQKVAGVGNVLRHAYERTAPEVLWSVARDDLLALDKVCREVLAREANPKQHRSSARDRFVPTVLSPHRLREART